MNSSEDTSSKRKNNETPSIAKMRFDQLAQAMEDIPRQKPTQRSELKKAVSADPEELFENYFINPKRGSIGFEIKSKLTRKNSKRQKSKKSKKDKKQNNNSGNEDSAGLLKCKQLYKECLKKKPDYVSKINIEEFINSFTPIQEKKNEETGSSEEKNKSETKKINFSLLTPSDHFIKIPNSYRRKKAKKHEKKLN